MIFVTGGTGMLGNVIVRKLIEIGEKPKVLVHPQDMVKSIINLNVKIIKGDITDAKLLEREIIEADIVFHLAAIVSILPWGNKKIDNVNVLGTKQVADLCMKYHKKLIYVSSVHAFSEYEDQQVINEITPISPDLTKGAYGKSKAKAALIIMNYAKAGLDVVTVCPTGIIGPYDFKPSQMGNFFLNYLNGKLNTIIDGAFDFVDVRDVADATIAAYKRGKKGEFYILGNKTIQISKLISLLDQVTNKKSRLKILGNKLAYFISTLFLLKYFFTKKEPLLTPYSIHTLNTKHTFSHEKASKELGYRTRPIEETLRDTINWFKTRNN